MDDDFITYKLLDPRTGEEPIGDSDEHPIPIGLYWSRDRWQASIESYTEPSLALEIPMEDEHLGFIGQHFRIPPSFLPLETIKLTSPVKLKAIREILDEFGQESVEAFFFALAEKGIRLAAYAGSGGWGHVFKVFEESRPSDFRALKLLRRPYGQNWVRRFQNEAQVLSKLGSKPGIAKLVAPIDEEEGLMFLQTEFIDGVPLSENTEPMGTKQALDLISQVLEVLQVVHREGIIHRDLHLGNVMTSGKLVTVLDFGLARDEEGADAYMTFKPVGAMSHRAPEKWTHPSSAGPASDIFSVGVMLYRLLTGAPPFWAGTEILLYEQIKTGKYEPASSRSTAVPSFVDAILQEMLAPTIEKRTPTALEALELIQSVQPTLELLERHHSVQNHAVRQNAPMSAAGGDRTIDHRQIKKLEKVLAKANVSLSEKLPAPLRDVGGHCWVVVEQRTDTHISDVLARVARWRSGSIPPNPPRTWKKGQGVVGWCWLTGEDVVQDLYQEALLDLTPERWVQLPSHMRMGRSFTEFRRAQLDFRVIYASPIYREDQLLGCVSFNVDRDIDAPIQALNNVQIREVIRLAAWECELVLP